MDKRIFKKCPTLGEYHMMALPYVKMEFYYQHKEMIDMEAKIYSEIFNDRKKLGSDDKIHKMNYDERNN